VSYNPLTGGKAESALPQCHIGSDKNPVIRLLTTKCAVTKIWLWMHLQVCSPLILHSTRQTHKHGLTAACSCTYTIGAHRTTQLLQASQMAWPVELAGSEVRW